MKVARAAFTFFLFALAVLVSAQAPTMDAPAEIKQFAWLHGNWAGKVHWSSHAATPGMDVPETWEVSEDAQFLKMISLSDMAGMKMRATTYLSWDGEKKQYISYTFTNFSPEPRIERGGLEGNVLTTVCDPWRIPGAEPVVGRAILTKKSDKELSYTLEFKEGDKWTKVAEGTLTKK